MAPIGLLSNLIAIPLAAVAVPGVLASLAFGGVFAGGAGLALMLIERVAVLSAAVPGGHIVGIAGAGFALPWVLILLGAVWGVRHKRDLRRPQCRSPVPSPEGSRSPLCRRGHAR